MADLHLTHVEVKVEEDSKKYQLFGSDKQIYTQLNDKDGNPIDNLSLREAIFGKHEEVIDDQNNKTIKYIGIIDHDYNEQSLMEKINANEKDFNNKINAYPLLYKANQLEDNTYYALYLSDTFGSNSFPPNQNVGGSMILGSNNSVTVQNSLVLGENNSTNRANSLILGSNNDSQSTSMDNGGLVLGSYATYCSSYLENAADPVTSLLVVGGGSATSPNLFEINKQGIAFYTKQDATNAEGADFQGLFFTTEIDTDLGGSYKLTTYLKHPVKSSEQKKFILSYEGEDQETLGLSFGLQIGDETHPVDIYTKEINGSQIVIGNQAGNTSILFPNQTLLYGGKGTSTKSGIYLWNYAANNTQTEYATGFIPEEDNFNLLGRQDNRWKEIHGTAIYGTLVYNEKNLPAFLFGSDKFSQGKMAYLKMPETTDGNVILNIGAGMNNGRIQTQQVALYPQNDDDDSDTATLYIKDNVLYCEIGNTTYQIAPRPL